MDGPRDSASGHKPSNVHDRYVNFTDKQLTNAFRMVMLTPDNLFTGREHGQEVENPNAASY
jgi:hypothetical protein